MKNAPNTVDRTFSRREKGRPDWTAFFGNQHLHRNIAIKQRSIMGATKTEHFTDSQNQTAALLKALGHPARIAIIEYLLKVDACICGDIVAELPLSQPTVSQHLKELKTAGLIKGNVEGNTICYCIDPDTFQIAQSFLTSVFSSLQRRKPNCC